MIRKVLLSTRNIRLMNFSNKATMFGQKDYDPSKDYYLTLGVSKNANESEIKSAYYKLAKVHHPDHSQGNDVKFKQINQAYEVLSHGQKRKQYDTSRTFGDFTKGFKGKAQQGSYKYQDYSSIYGNMSPQQQEQVRRRAQALIRRFLLFSFGTIFFWMLFTRRPNNFYNEANGQLVPISSQEVLSTYAPNAMYNPQANLNPNYNYGSPYNYNPNAQQYQAQRAYPQQAYNPNQQPYAQPAYTNNQK